MYQFTTPPLAPVAQTPLAAAGEVAPPLAQVGALGAAPAAPPAGLALAITTTIAPLFAAQTAAMLAALDTQTAAMTAALTAQTVTMTAALAGQNVTMAAALNHFERRSIARSTNLLISQDRFPITPLVNNNGNIPRNFPATTRALKGLKRPALTALLRFYGLPAGARTSLPVLKKTLASFCGLRYG